MSCFWCGKELEQHAEKPGRVVPRMPCLGLRKHYCEGDKPRCAVCGNPANKHPLPSDICPYYSPVKP